MAKLRGIAAQISRQRRPLSNVQRGRSSRPLALAQAVQTMDFATPNPALYRATVFTKQLGYLLAALPTGDRQQTMQPMVL